MTRIDVEHRPHAGAPWWTWLLVAVLIILIAYAAWYFLSERRGTSMTPGGQQPGAIVLRMDAAPGVGVMGSAQEHVVWIN